MGSPPPLATDSPPDIEALPPAKGVVKLMFLPMRAISRRAAPRLSTRLFERVWGIVDDQQPPPRPQARDGSMPKLALALALEGACRTLVGGLLDQATRRQFARLTGRWPGPTSPALPLRTDVPADVSDGD